MKQLQGIRTMRQFLASLKEELNGRLAVSHVRNGRRSGFLTVATHDGRLFECSIHQYRRPELSRFQVGSCQEHTSLTSELAGLVPSLATWALMVGGHPASRYHWTPAAVATLPQAEQARFAQWGIPRELDPYCDPDQVIERHLNHLEGEAKAQEDRKSIV